MYKETVLLTILGIGMQQDLGDSTAPSAPSANLSCFRAASAGMVKELQPTDVVLLSNAYWWG